MLWQIQEEVSAGVVAEYRATADHPESSRTKERWTCCIVCIYLLQIENWKIAQDILLLGNFPSPFNRKTSIAANPVHSVFLSSVGRWVCNPFSVLLLLLSIRQQQQLVVHLPRKSMKGIGNFPRQRHRWRIRIGIGLSSSSASSSFWSVVVLYHNLSSEFIHILGLVVTQPQPESERIILQFISICIWNMISNSLSNILQ